MDSLIRTTPDGLSCPAGGFTIDPRRPVPLAVITHAHRDHARRGSREHVCSRASLELLELRLGRGASFRPLEFGEPLKLGGVEVSLHPAGHMLGSAQVRVERAGEVWVVSGDYKRQEDPSCEPFEVVPCDTFVTEATFARPSFEFAPPAETVTEILAWWRENQEAGRVATVFAYALGKAQRLLAELGRRMRQPVYVHAQVEPYNECYRQSGVALAATRIVPRKLRGMRLDGELVIAPPRFLEPSWYERLGDVRTALASGWSLTGAAAEAGCDRGFALSDHADWNEILATIHETGARRILVHHGDPAELVRHLREQGFAADALAGTD